MRNLEEVVTAMLHHVPERSVQFRYDLVAASTPDEYLAPVELSHEHWSQTARILAKHIPANPQHRQPWMNEVMRIWNDSN